MSRDNRPKQPRRNESMSEAQSPAHVEAVEPAQVPVGAVVEVEHEKPATCSIGPNCRRRYVKR